MVNCAVTTCHSFCDGKKNVGRKSFFVFPKDEELRKAWAERCGLDELQVKEFARVCSDHFAECDFKPTKKRKLLLPEAVPWVDVPGSGLVLIIRPAEQEQSAGAAASGSRFSSAPSTSHCQDRENSNRLTDAGLEDPARNNGMPMAECCVPLTSSEYGHELMGQQHSGGGGRPPAARPRLWRADLTTLRLQNRRLLAANQLLRLRLRQLRLKLAGGERRWRREMARLRGRLAEERPGMSAAGTVWRSGTAE